MLLSVSSFVPLLSPSGCDEAPPKPQGEPFGFGPNKYPAMTTRAE